MLDPDLADAHYHRANLLGALRRFDEAVAGYDDATNIRPHFAQAWNNRARALRALRRLDESLLSWDRAIALEPADTDAHLNRGNVLMEIDRPEEALASYGRALALTPDLAEAHYNRATAALRLGRAEDALQDFDRTIALKPGYAEAHHMRANVLDRLGRQDEAVQGFQRAVALKPDLVESHNNKGNLLCRLGRQAEAVDSYTRAVQRRPDYALAWSNRGSALKAIGRFEDALESCDRAIGLAPDLAAAHHNRGNALKGLKRLEDAIGSFERAIELVPAFEDAHRNRATTTLLTGDFERGWRLYERRNAGMSVPPNSGSIWTGTEDLEGKTLLIGAEQGFGDTFQFCRYAPLAAARGAKVTLAVQDPLVALLKCLEPETSVTALSTAPAGFDYYIPLLSMPHAFQTRANNIPSTVPYLHPDPDKIRHWRDRIGSEGFRIGICWQGAVGGEVDIGRSFPVRHFAPLAEIPGTRLISLQKNAGVEQLHDLPAGMTVEAFGDALDPGPQAFVDTAAAMENLDLVITSDTAVAHLAGALGRRTWLALNYVPDWRWLLDRDESPWYPTMKLFRQPRRNDWAGVFAAIRTSLLELLSTNWARP
jgi:tetratricopeptide (TPR) repeat protein